MRCALGLLLGVLLASSPSRAAPAKSFAEWLPADTIAFLELAPLTPEEQKRAVAYKAMEEPELRRVLDRMLGENGNFSRLAVPMGQATVRAAMDIRESGIAFEVRYDEGKKTRALRVRGHLAVAWVGLERQPRANRLMPDLALAMRVENEPDEAHDLVRALLVASLREQGGRTALKVDDRVVSWSHRDCRCTSVRTDGLPVHVATVGRRIVLATRRARLVDIIDRAAGAVSDAPSLAASEFHRETIRRATGSGTITSFLTVNVRAGMDAFAKSGAPSLMNLPQMARIVGLGGLEGLTSVTRVDGVGVAGTTSVLLEGRRAGIARLFEKGPPAKYGCLSFAPKDSLYVAAGRFDMPGMFQALAEAALPAAQFIAITAQQQAGVNVLEDVIQRIGPEAAFIFALNSGLIPDVGVVFESSDANKLRAAVLKILAAIEWEPGTGVENTRIGGVDAHVIKMLHPRMSDVPIAPTFGVVDGHFVAALYPISFQRFVATKRGERPSIESNREFAEMRKRVPADALSLSYLDVRRGVTIAYDTVMPLLQAMPQHEGGVPIYEFPEASIFAKHLYGRIAWRVADDRGMHWHSHSSTDVGAVLLGLGAAGSSLLFLSVDTTPERKRGVPPPPPPQEDISAKHLELHQCMTNVRHIKNQLGRLKWRKRPFPDKLEDLRGRWIDENTLIVPGTDQKPYTYLGPDGRNGILLYGAPNGPDGNICVLTTDLKMKRVSPPLLRRLLEGK